MRTIQKLKLFQDDQIKSICPGTYPPNAQFTLIKVGRVTVQKVSRFDVKLTNKFEVLMKEDPNESDSDQVTHLKPMSRPPAAKDEVKQKKKSEAKIEQEKSKWKYKSVTSEVPIAEEGYQWKVLKQKGLSKSKNGVSTLKNGVSKFKTPNPFRILEDRDEEMLENVILSSEFRCLFKMLKMLKGFIFTKNENVDF